MGRRGLPEPDDAHRAYKPHDHSSYSYVNETGQDNVWRWLSQTDDHHGPTEGSDQESMECRRYKGSRHRPRCSEDSPWYAHGNPTTFNQSLPARNPFPNRQRTSKRTQPQSADSSIISELQIPVGTQRKRHRPATVLERSATPESSELVPQELPPSASLRDGPSHFEKRPRHKTREDKYESKKSKGHQPEGASSKPRRKSEKTKRKAIASGKNVMNNFISDAVLNDRITVSTKLYILTDYYAYT